MHDAELHATAGSERPGAARKRGLPKSPHARMSTVGPVTVAPVTRSASGGVLAGRAPAVADAPFQKVASQWRRRGRPGLTVVAAVTVVGLLVNERDLIASSFRMVEHLEWAWFVLAVPSNHCRWPVLLACRADC